jgi:Retroviral aspartyl protease
VITGLLQSRLHLSQARRIQILLDSGALQSIVHKNMVTDHVSIPQSKSTTWKTVAGTFRTMVKTTVTFKLPTLHETRTIETEMHVTNSINNYDMIVGQDLLQELGIVLHFADQTIVWDQARTPMKSYQSLPSNDIVAMESESPAVVKATEQMKQILEAKHELVDTKEVVA